MVRMLWSPCLILAAVTSGPARPAARPAPVYEVYAIEYAKFAGFPASALILGADSTRKFDLSMMVWLIKGEGRVILVDAGFYRKEFLDSWKVTDYRKPSDAVKAFGVKPEDVTDIIISHMHWDHADGADLFPNAKVWVQKTEYQFYLDPKNQQKTGVFPSDVQMFGEIAKAARLKLVNGDAQMVASGVTAYIGGRHTKESQYVSVVTRSGVVVLASDNVYTYENIDHHRPIAATWDTVSNLAAQDRMVRMAKAGLVVPGHDPRVFARFTKVKPGVVRID